MRPGLDRVPRIHPEAGVERVGGRLLAVSMDSVLHRFEEDDGSPSEVAERIVELVDGQRTLEQLVHVLCEEFEVERAVCERDALEFVTLLLNKQVLVLS
jgi:Coenzyme PQQ synthesis protein D (PqqD)